jgi:hypothetical protein
MILAGLRQRKPSLPQVTVPAIEDGGDGVGTVSSFGKAALASILWFMVGDEIILILS